MIIYFAGINESFLEKVDYKVPVLQSYFYCKNNPVDKFSSISTDFFLDCGAFSAKSIGAVIDIDDYIKYIHENKQNTTVYAGLDVIGNHVDTGKNQKYMESCGLNPIPAYHYGEPIEVFKDLINNYEYIALGGVPPARKEKIKYFDSCFELICDKDGKPRNKIHGFAVTATDLMSRYPFHSVDSTSAILTSAMGGIFNKDGLLIKLGQNSTISLQDRKYIEDNYEDTVDDLRNFYKLRIKINVDFFTNLSKELMKNPPRFVNKQLKLF